MATRLWLQQITRNAERDLIEIPAKLRLDILDAIEELLTSSNPLTVSNVRNIVGRPGIWRRRKGNYRILFELDSRPIERNGVHYKGKLIIVAVSKRDESTYR